LKSSDKIEVNQGFKNAVPLSPTLLDLYLDKMIKKWQKNMKVNFKMNNMTLAAVTFEDDKAIISDTEMEFSEQYFMGRNNEDTQVKHSIKKSKTLAFKVK
jgi:hypothetical protein